MDTRLSAFVGEGSAIFCIQSMRTKGVAFWWHRYLVDLLLSSAVVLVFVFDRIIRK